MSNLRYGAKIERQVDFEAFLVVKVAVITCRTVLISILPETEARLKRLRRSKDVEQCFRCEESLA